MSPELQKVLTDALVVIVPIISAVLTAWFTGWKNRRDTDAAFKKIRAHEDFLGIKTDQKGEIRVFDSTRSTLIQGSPSPTPQGSGESQGPAGAA